MHRASRFAACSTALLLAACMKKEAPKDTTTAMAPAAAPAPAPAAAPTLALADMTGKWKVTNTPAAGKDTSTTTATLTATADTTGWTLELPGGQKVPLQVSVSGDSLMAKSAVYSSVRRKGKKVWTESTFHLSGGKLTGTTVAHYEKAGADSLLTLKSEGTKMP